MLRRLNAIVAHFALALACALALGAVSLFPAASEAQQAEATASPPSYPPNSQPGLSQTLSGGLRIQLNRQWPTQSRSQSPATRHRCL